MIGLILRRLVLIVPTVASVAVLIFGLLYLTPGDPAVIIAGDRASPEEVAQLRVALALDAPVHQRFARWAGGVVSGDLGKSIYTQRPVTELIASHLIPTASLVVASLVLACLIAVPFGVLVAHWQGSLLDRLLTVGTIAAFSVPIFVIGYVLAYIFGVWLRWLPVQGFVSPGQDVFEFIRHIILPSVSLSVVYAALILRTTRASMIETLNHDYIRTAHAKGLGINRILLLHGLKNSSVPVITVIGIGFAALIGGAVVTETVFAIPGVGRLTVDSILRRDYPVIQGVVLTFSGVFILVNLIVDISYSLLDPRVRQ
ncbi:ABC transporter permease [Aminobacter aminovorans]|uniref:Peptide ABC transporter n=1 Tax=Aminobacter aminovorans TaxID=83263 RepID=A0AAC8YWL9_AMIAI|nr:ABC transporter permease [Aminobacter aminovorans]AMS45454.1 peptide ABC transporter [Aminobacter aminovorans]MBB3708661.1 peptide/nickel transport system permease protein [Aminobacter aminovorans]